MFGNAFAPMSKVAKKMSLAGGFTDGETHIAKGTPMSRPKIGNSIVDVIGGTS